MSDELVNYIVQQINLGYKVDDIESFLKNNGYPVGEIKSSITTAVDLAAKSYLNYIDQQINAGYKLAQLRSMLVDSGYDYRIIDCALNYYHKNLFSVIKSKIDEHKQEEVRKKQLTNQIDQSVQQGLNYGLTLENIQSNLLNQGYDNHLVSKEINKFRQSHIHLSKSIVIIFILLTTLSGISLFLYNNLDFSQTSPAMQERLLDVTVENSQPSVDLYPGMNLNFHVRLVPMGYEREFDIDFEYRIYDRNDNIIRRSAATKSTVSNLADQITIPSSITPGTYKLKVIAEYMGEAHARASFEFDVLSRDGVDDAVLDKDAEDDVDDFVDDVIIDEDIEDDIDEIIVEDETDKGDELDGEVDLFEEIEETPEYVESDFERIGTTRILRSSDISRLGNLINRGDEDYALFLCDRISDVIYSRECKLFIALESNNIGICYTFDLNSSKERCILEFAQFSSDKSICEDLTNRQSKRLCDMFILRNKNLDLQGIESRYDFHNKVKELYG